MRILIIEDEITLNRTLQEGLTDFGYQVDAAENYKDAEYFIDIRNYDLVLTDWMLPDGDGIELCKIVKNRSSRTAVVILSARDDKDSVFDGFNCGCDDYIKKPFDIDELLARVKATLKRKNPTLTYKDINFDLLENRVLKANEEVSLGNVEKDIFSLLIRNIGMTVSKSSFFDYMNKPSETGLRVLISKLKKVLEIEITNTKGIGYKLEKL